MYSLDDKVYIDITSHSERISRDKNEYSGTSHTYVKYPNTIIILSTYLVLLWGVIKSLHMINASELHCSFAVCLFELLNVYKN